jgi:hypothetical protein
VCDGDWLVDVPPSPNVHAQLVGPPVLVSANVTANGAVPLVGLAVNDAVGATGAVPTVIVRDADVEPPAFVAVRRAVYVPAAV